MYLMEAVGGRVVGAVEDHCLLLLVAERLAWVHQQEVVACCN
jgi:hypothetical protein